MRRLIRFARARTHRAAEALRSLLGPIGVDAVRVNGDLWRSISNDPRLVFRAPQRRGRILVVELAADRDILAPRLYFDWGEGFAQDRSVGLQAGPATLLRLDLSDCPDLVRLRLDPCETEAEFVFRWGFDGRGMALAAESTPGIARHEIAAREFAPPQSKRPATDHEHYLNACALAERELRGHFVTPPAAPEISFVTPVYDTPPAFLDDLLASFRAQAPGYAELVLSDDGSTSPATASWLEAHAREPELVVLRHARNRGIAAASNAGIAAARGRWVGFVDHDDALAPYAVAVLLRAIADNPGARFFYTDEMLADAQLKGIESYDKPAFDDVLLSGCNYLNHISLYRRDLIEEVGGFREGFEGSQDYDLVLRALARLSRDQIRHVPYPAYLWRRHGGNYSVKSLEAATSSARRALGEAYARDGQALEVSPAILTNLHRVRLDLVAPRPKISVVVPNRNAPKLMAALADGLFRRTDYPDFEVIVVDNGSDDRATLALYARLKRERDNFTLLSRPAPFNFSAQVNLGVALARGEAILLLNNDVEVISKDWISEMVGCLAFRDVGIVGARLLYPNRRLQHAGVVLGLNGGACHWFLRRPADYPGPMGRLAVRSTMTAVTGACMLISRACWQATGPFDEEGFAVAFNDVDFCLRARAAGFRAVYTPFATLIHHESASRGADDRGPKRARFMREAALLMERHGADTFEDPVMSRWRGRKGTEPELVSLDRLPPAR